MTNAERYEALAKARVALEEIENETVCLGRKSRSELFAAGKLNCAAETADVALRKVLVTAEVLLGDTDAKKALAV